MKCIEHLARLGHCSKCFPCTNGIGTIGLRQLLELKKFLCGQVGCGLRLFDSTSQGINCDIVSSDYARICLFRPPFEIVRYFPCLHCDDCSLLRSLMASLGWIPGNTVSLSECGPIVKATTHRCLTFQESEWIRNSNSTVRECSIQCSLPELRIVIILHILNSIWWQTDSISLL